MTNPTAYRRLQNEVDKYFPEGDNAMDTSRHTHMPYLNAVMYVDIVYLQDSLLIYK